MKRSHVGKLTRFVLTQVAEVDATEEVRKVAKAVEEMSPEPVLIKRGG